MNYRTMVKGALALSLSLIVGSVWARDVQKYGATFEPTPSEGVNDFAYTEGDGITNAKYRVTNVSKPYGWFSGSAEGDESKIVARVAEGSTQALQLNTDASTLTNKLAESVADEINTNGIAKSGAYIETEVKFVASDTDSAGIQGGQDATKFAIYAYCNEDAQRPEGEPATTNLVVFFKYSGIDENEEPYSAYTNEVMKDITINTEEYTKLRVEMKRMLDGEDLVNVFKVTVGEGEDAKVASSLLALDSDGTTPGVWFKTVEDAEGLSDNTAVSSINFKGTGEVDNLAVGVIETVPNVATVFTVANNVTNNISSYATLAEAIAAATDGATVLVLDDLTLDARVEPNVGANTAITIDLGGKTITRTGTTGNGSAFDIKSGNVLITNGVIVCTQDDTAIAKDGVYAITSRSGSNVTLADLVVLVNSECGACAYPFAGSTLTIDSGAYSNLTQTVYRYNTAITGMAVNQPNIADQLLIINGGTFSQYDPQLGDDSGAMTDFTAEGFVAISDGNGGWVVQPGYNVTFDADGGTPAPEAQRVAAGGTATAPTAPEKEGFTFGGWTLNGAAFDFDTVLDADIALVASWNEVVPATIISVAKLSATGAMVNDAAPALTATVTDENGDAVAAADYTIDASAIDMTTAGLYPVIITATGAGYAGTLTNYYAVMNLTWFNGTPTQKALIVPQNVTLSGMHYTHTSQDGAYLAIGASNGDGNGQGHLLYSVATLKSLYGICSNEWEVAHNTSGGGKGMAVNTASGIMLNGRSDNKSISGNQSSFVGYDIGDLANIGNTSNMVQETYTADWTGAGVVTVMDGIDFNHAGTKVFGNNSRADGPWVYQLAIDKNAKTMTWEATYTTDFGRVRSVTAYYIDGKDYVFVGEGAGSGHGEIAVIDPSDGSITKICVAADDFTTAEFPAGRYFTNVKVSGIASGEMYLYGSTDKGEVVIWALGHDAVTGEWKTAPVGNITSAQTASFNGETSVPTCRAFNVSDDNTAGFLYAQPAKSNVDSQFAVVTDISLAQRKALASATLTPAGSYQDVELGEITATVLDANGDTVAASEYTITTNAIDIATLGEYTVTITPVEGSVYSNAVTAVYTISEEPAAPTVITIALVNGATYTDAEGVLTFAAPEGYVVNSIYTNGVNTGSTTTFTTNGLTGTINIVAAAKKVRPAVAHKWYENPGLVQAFNYPYYTDQQTGYHWDIDSTDAFLAAPSGFGGAGTGGALLFSVDSLEAANSASIYQFEKNEAPLSLASIRGSAVAPQLNVMLIGSYNNTGLVSLPLSAEVFAWDENAFHIYTDNGVTPDCLHFSDDGLTLYATANAPSTARNYVFKYRVLDGLKSSGTNLVLEATWDVGSRTRALEIAKVGNTTFAYVHCGAGIKVIDVDNSSSEPVDAGAAAEGSYDDMDVSGTHFYIYHGETGKLRIFDIAADGKLSLFKTITQDELAAALGCTSIKIATSAGLAVTDDEKTIFFTNFDGGNYHKSETMIFFVAQYVEPPTPAYDVDWTGSDGVTVTTNGIALTGITSGTFEENTVITFTPTDSGATITNILVGGVAQTGFDPASFSLTVVSDTNIVVLAGVEAQAGYNYPEGGAIEDAAVVAWLTAKGFTQAQVTALGTNAKLNECYLLNCDISQAGAGGSIAITAITVDAQGVHVTVALTRTAGIAGGINGTLKLQGTADLATAPATLTEGVSVENAKFTTDSPATATFTGSGAKFFKAVIE